MEYYTVTEWILAFGATWVDFEGIMLSEIRQTKTNTTWSYLHVESQKNPQSKLIVTEVGMREMGEGSR